MKELNTHIEFDRQYAYIANLYEKQELTYVEKENLYFILDKETEEDKKYFYGNFSSAEIQQYITGFIAKNRLKKELCEKIRKSPTLRYFLIASFHDCKMIEISPNNEEITITVDCGGCVCTPKGCKNNTVQLKFRNPKALTISGEKNIQGFYQDKSYISYMDNDTLRIVLEFSSRGENIIRKTSIAIICDTVDMEY